MTPLYRSHCKKTRQQSTKQALYGCGTIGEQKLNPENKRTGIIDVITSALYECRIHKNYWEDVAKDNVSPKHLLRCG